MPGSEIDIQPIPETPEIGYQLSSDPQRSFLMQKDMT
jgi:hypothetical protein